ncbi:hypothetical protein MAR_028370 [Mya arenaria]|uniref:Uncharacterized protein n=1 Tax=Mya arenaria TaxID=6604 RepID=A0ABY7DH83_MYAAR|nr:hypothetical protein MAR_028370 [Mya arenaria]
MSSSNRKLKANFFAGGGEITASPESDSGLMSCEGPGICDQVNMVCQAFCDVYLTLKNGVCKKWAEQGSVKGKENMERFMSNEYTYPTPNDDCDETLPSTSTETLGKVCVDLAGELVTLRKEKQSIEEELNSVIDEKDVLNDSVEQYESSIEKQRKQLKRTSNRESYWRSKYQKIEKDNDKEHIEDDMISLQLNIENLEHGNRMKDNLIDDLNERPHELENQNIEQNKLNNCEFFYEKSKTYSLDLHACVYSLLDNHVALENVGDSNKLPSVGTIHNWSIERGIIAKQQIAESSNEHNTTLHTDEASKYGNKWGAFASRDQQGNYTLLGLKEMATKSSHDTLETLKDILNHIDDVTDDGTGNKLLVNIKNTKSDRTSTETKFNEF